MTNKTNKSFGAFNTLVKSSNFNPRPKPNIIKANMIGAILVTISTVLPVKLNYINLLIILKDFFYVHGQFFQIIVEKCFQIKK